MQRSNKTVLLVTCAAICLSGLARGAGAAEFDESVQPLVTAKCVKCHGLRESQGKINFQAIGSAAQMLAQPELIQRMIEAIDANEMPPDGEPPLASADRVRFLASLKTMLRQSSANAERRPAPMHRLNRFQYNNAVRDLFQLDRDVFELPEKLLTRQDPYVPSKTGKMPDKVNVVSQSLSPPAGLAGVYAFPKDLRAEHGFDNQSNKLTLSPLLLDAFLRLSVSIVESPDFNPKSVGIWEEFFQPPAEGSNAAAEIERRLKKFLRLAFRGPLEESTLKRYASYTTRKMQQGLSFTGSMKKVASAVLCSPMFLYLSSGADGPSSRFELASRLSLFLWASIPDEPLLDLAQQGELARPEVLQKTIARMLADRKIERFLDTFPAQWMQLENLLAVTPDPKKSRYFSLDENYPASLQMVIEPLLLFDAVFIENRPVVELIAPRFSYRSEFLQDWYESDFRPPQVDANEVLAKNHELEQRRRDRKAIVAIAQAEVDTILTGPQQEHLDAANKKLAQAKSDLAKVRPPYDLKTLRQDVQRQYDEQVRTKLRSPVFERVATTDPRYGGVITNAAVLSMTSGPLRTQPIARGAWVIEVIFNDPPPPPPNDVPPLNEEDTAHLTIREQFAAHRANPSCAGCHARIDPLGFALENFDITGRWRDKYENGKPVDASGTLLRKYPFAGAVDFKASLVKEPPRFARAFIAHLLRFALSRELTPADAITIDTIINQSAGDDFRLQSLIREVALSESFLQSN